MYKKIRYRNIGLILVLSHLILLTILDSDSLVYRQYSSILLDVIRVSIFLFFCLAKNRKLLMIGLIISFLGLNVSFIELQLLKSSLLSFGILLDYKYYIDIVGNGFLLVGFLELFGNTKINNVVEIDLKSLLFKLVIITFFIQIMFYLS